MFRSKLLATAVILSAVSATPVLAQAVINEPGVYAFYHPNADLGLGSKWPSDAMASAQLRGNGNMVRLRSATMSHPLPVKHSRSMKPY